MQTYAFDCLIEAGAFDRLPDLSDKISQLNRYLRRLLPGKETPSIVNKALKYKVDVRDLKAVEKLAKDDLSFRRLTLSVEQKISASPRACVNWWSQSQLIVAIVAAEYRNRNHLPVNQTECEALDGAIEHVIAIYDRLLVKLKAMWVRRPIWQRIGTRISEAWRRLKRFLMRLPAMIVSKVSFVQDWAARSPKHQKALEHNVFFGLSLGMGTLMLMFGNVQNSAIQLLRLIAGGTLTSGKQRAIANSMVKMFIGREAQLLVGWLKTFTRPPLYTASDAPKVGNDVLEQSLGGIVSQIRSSRYQPEALKRLFDETCFELSNPQYRDVGVVDERELLDLGRKLHRNDLVFQSPFSKRIYVFSGSHADLASQFEHAFARGMFNLSRSYAPEQMVSR